MSDEKPQEHEINEMTFDVNRDVRKDVVAFISAYDDKSPRIVRIAITKDGIIMDFYDNAELSSTIGMTYEEWFDYSAVKPIDSSKSTKPRHRR